MKYGMNLLLWSGEIVEEHYPILDKLKELGYDGVEVPIFNLDLSIYEKLGKKLDELGLECTAVTVRNEDDNPISSDNATRAAGVANNKLALDCCAAMKAQNLVGPYHSAIGIFSGSGPTEDEFKWGVDSMRQTAEYAATVGVTLGVECLNRFAVLGKPRLAIFDPGILQRLRLRFDRGTVTLYVIEKTPIHDWKP